jgi:hypothetical protein
MVEPTLQFNILHHCKRMSNHNNEKDGKIQFFISDSLTNSGFSFRISSMECMFVDNVIPGAETTNQFEKFEECQSEEDPLQQGSRTRGPPMHLCAPRTSEKLKILNEFSITFRNFLLICGRFEFETPGLQDYFHLCKR